MAKELSYKEQIFEYIDRLPAGTVSLDKLCKTETREKFTKVMKEYITERGNHNGYCTEFTNDYSAIRKWDLILITPSEKLKREIKDYENL